MLSPISDSGFRLAKDVPELPERVPLKVVHLLFAWNKTCLGFLDIQSLACEAVMPKRPLEGYLCN